MTNTTLTDTMFITDNLINPIKLITNNDQLTNLEFFLVGAFLIFKADYESTPPNKSKFIIFKITPHIANLEKITNTFRNLLNSFQGETRAEAAKQLIDDLRKDFGTQIPDGFDEEKLAVYFTQLTPEIIEYFQTQKLYNPRE